LLYDPPPRRAISSFGGKARPFDLRLQVARLLLEDGFDLFPGFRFALRPALPLALLYQRVTGAQVAGIQFHGAEDHYSMRA